ncbi:MAG: hypothetical protein FWF92_09335 [Oscillospiraceae bacterium]|nr:hypothetical protein [Oscillospiraceae bacterium]
MPLFKIPKINRSTSNAIELREMWSNEVYFSKWLSEKENLRILSNAIGINIVFEELESAVGSLSVDLYAIEKETGKKIIIENQLENADPDHFGRIIIYAAGKEAEIVIWIVKDARDEYIQAIKWLNKQMNKDIGFFLIEVIVWKSDNLPPIPEFRIIEKPWKFYT